LYELRVALKGKKMAMGNVPQQYCGLHGKESNGSGGGKKKKKISRAWGGGGGRKEPKTIEAAKAHSIAQTITDYDGEPKGEGGGQVKFLSRSRDWKERARYLGFFVKDMYLISY